MIFEKDKLYHVYNQGNNRKKLFYTRNNYLLFKNKIEASICPYADILAWCLMPNHFHLMMLIKEIDLPYETQPPLVSTQNENILKTRTLNDSIGIMLRSYTRTINSRNDFTGSLFRKKTKAKCINSFKHFQPNFWESKLDIFNMLSEKQYPQVCFNYIHNNPVKSGLVKKDTDWEFSSARDYANLRNKSIVKKKIAKNYIDF